jgi:hypothetical protein
VTYKNLIIEWPNDAFGIAASAIPLRFGRTAAIGSLVRRDLNEAGLGRLPMILLRLRRTFYCAFDHKIILGILNFRTKNGRVERRVNACKYMLKNNLQ